MINIVLELFGIGLALKLLCKDAYGKYKDALLVCIGHSESNLNIVFGIVGTGYGVLPKKTHWAIEISSFLFNVKINLPDFLNKNII